MTTFDTLPPPLRQWLTGAVLPWSPASARRIWAKTRAKGLSVEDTLAEMAAIEARTLARDAAPTIGMRTV